MYIGIDKVIVGKKIDQKFLNPINTQKSNQKIKLDFLALKNMLKRS